jgi:hypothetical protein
MGKQCDAACERADNARAMNQGIGADFARAINPVTFEEGMHFS